MSAECENKFFSSSKCNDTQLLSVDGEWPGGGASGGGSIIEAATDCEIRVNGSAVSVLKPFVCQLGCDEKRSIGDHADRREVLVTEEVSRNAPSELVIGTEMHLSAENQLNNQ